LHKFILPILCFVMPAQLSPASAPILSSDLTLAAEDWKCASWDYLGVLKVLDV